MERIWMTALVRKHASGGAISSEREHGGVGFFHAAAVIAATEEGNNARMADQGRERGWLRRRREKQPFLVAVRRARSSGIVSRVTGNGWAWAGNGRYKQSFRPSWH